MGTNFYCIAKASREQKKQAVKHLNELLSYIKDSDYILPELVQQTFEVINIPKEIHLGKRSAGWQFLWDYHNGEYFKPTLSSIKEFLKDKYIYNEYDEHFTLEQFFNDELKDCLYADEYHDSGRGSEYSSEYFYNDNLRFAKWEDFS